MQGLFLVNYKKDEVRQTLQKINAVFKEVDSQSLIKTTANLISKGNAIKNFKEEWNLDQGHLVQDLLLQI